MAPEQEIRQLFRDMKAVCGGKTLAAVSKLEQRFDEMTGEIEALKYANSLDSATGDILASQPGFLSIKFTPLERSLLAYVIGRGSNGASYDGAYEALYSHRLDCDQPDRDIIKVLMCKVRKKLAKAGLNCRIENSWGRGYVYIPDAGMKRRDVIAV
jgi:DNA-binding response OmpR family regulator